MSKTQSTDQEKQRKYACLNTPSISTEVELCIPIELRQREQWINYGSSKQPISPHTQKIEAANEPDTWASFSNAAKAAEQYELGIGFVFTTDDPYVGIDLDDVVDVRNGAYSVDQEAMDIQHKLCSYVELSPSETGLHIIVKGDKPTDDCRASLDQGGEIEIYDCDRFFTVTGWRPTAATQQIKKATDGLEWIYDTYFDQATTSNTLDTSDCEATVKQVRRTIEEYAKTGSEAAQAALDLWQSTGPYGYKSASNADLAFVDRLAFWCKNDPELIDACFRASNRCRPKWTEERSSTDYSTLTIEEAIDTEEQIFNGHYVK